MSAIVLPANMSRGRKASLSLTNRQPGKLEMNAAVAESADLISHHAFPLTGSSSFSYLNIYISNRNLRRLVSQRLAGSFLRKDPAFTGPMCRTLN